MYTYIYIYTHILSRSKNVKRLCKIGHAILCHQGCRQSIDININGKTYLTSSVETSNLFQGSYDWP